MRRLLSILITLIIAGVAFTFLWLTNPLYAFVGAIVFVVFMIVGLALIYNSPTSAVAPEVEEALKPRRTGEFSRVRETDLPEASWEETGAEIPEQGLNLPAQQPMFGGSSPLEEGQKKQESKPSDNISDEIIELEEAKEDGSRQELPEIADEDEATIIPQSVPSVEPEPTPPPAPAPPPSKPARQRSSNEFDLLDMVSLLPHDKQQEFFALTTEIPIGEQTETQLIALYEKLANDEGNGETDPKILDEVQFSAFYPRQVAATTEYGLYVYAHLPDALVNEDVQQFAPDLGGRVPKAIVAHETAKIHQDTMLSAVITCDQLDFNQQGVMQRWQAPFVRFDFRFTANEGLIDELVTGRIAIMMGLIEIASIDFQIMIAPANPMAMVNAIPQDPRYAQNYQASAPINLYQTIFVSYSRKDTLVAEQYRKVQMMCGNTIFMDTHSIRAGEDWEHALQKAIDDADVFQLFWSEHSSTSHHVRFEWDYALTQRCPQTRCVQFIRPTYWQKPLPSIPDALSHLHFAFVELETN